MLAIKGNSSFRNSYIFEVPWLGSKACTYVKLQRRRIAPLDLFTHDFINGCRLDKMKHFIERHRGLEIERNLD